MRTLWKTILPIVAVIGLAFGFQKIVHGLDGDDGGDDAAQIESALGSYYEEPVPGQCALLTTERFRSTVYGGSGEGALEACREHQEARAKMARLDRSVFVDHVEVDGTKAVAEVRAGGISVTESLVEEGDEWRLDDEVSPFHDSAGSAGLDVAESEQDAAPKDLGSPSRFANIPGFGPAVSITLVPKKPVDPGEDKTGAKSARIRLLNPLGQPGPLTEVRFVNLPITLVNTGKQPFRGEIGLFAVADNGRQLIALDRRELTQRDGLLGRLPDWKVGEVKGIAPGESSTRYLTVATPVGHEIVEWQLEPRLLSGGDSVSSMESLDGNTYR
ncbi:MAG TPA: hypothetical protein VMS60_15155 [Solirubrobacterales bacterium]|nr:hypothetical protein [Solirubrobacterales bacterium]